MEHKPFLYPEDDRIYCMECSNELYPCSTIKNFSNELKLKTGHKGHKLTTKINTVTVEQWCDCKDQLHYQAIEKELE